MAMRRYESRKSAREERFPKGGRLEYYLLGPGAVSANWTFCTYQPLKASSSALAAVFVI